MRVLTLTTLYPNHIQPNLGVFIKNRIVALSLYADVTVVAPVPWAPRYQLNKKYSQLNMINKQETRDGLQVFHPRYFVTPRIGRRFYGLFYYHSLRKFICNLHKEAHFDILDVHWAYPDGYAGVLIARELGLPVSISLRGTDIHTFTERPAIRKHIAFALQQADKIIAVSRAMIPLIANLGANLDAVSVISNGVDSDRFQYKDQCFARNTLKLKIGRPIVLAVGRLESPKRFDLIIEACARIIRGGIDNLQLIIVGDGTQLDMLKRLVSQHAIEGNVVFAGSVNNTELSSWYSASDVFCLASDKEGCPNVVLESMSCGTPVVASDVGSVIDMITSAETGIIVSSNTVAAWTESLRAALSRNWQRRDISDTQKDNSWRQVGERVFELFKKEIGNRRTPVELSCL